MGLLAMDSLQLLFAEKVFILHSILKYVMAGSRIIGGQFFYWVICFYGVEVYELFIHLRC